GAVLHHERAQLLAVRRPGAEGAVRSPVAVGALGLLLPVRMEAGHRAVLVVLPDGGLVARLAVRIEQRGRAVALAVRPHGQLLERALVVEDRRRTVELAAGVGAVDVPAAGPDQLAPRRTGGVPLLPELRLGGGAVDRRGRGVDGRRVRLLGRLVARGGSRAA